MAEQYSMDGSNSCLYRWSYSVTTEDNSYQYLLPLPSKLLEYNNFTKPEALLYHSNTNSALSKHQQISLHHAEGQESRARLQK